MANQSSLVGLSIVTRKNLFDRYGPKSGAASPSPASNAGIFVPKSKRERPARIRIVRMKQWPMTGDMYQVREVWDYGLNRWYEIDRVRRADLDGKQEILFPMLGDESHAEVDEHLEMATSSEKDQWFKDRPKIDFQKIFDDIETERRHRANGRVTFGGLK